MATTDGMELNRKEKWEQEVFARHRWGRYSNKAREEHARLKKLWKTAQPFDEACQDIINQIISLEICNWRLEESILVLCTAIGTKKPVLSKIGHMASMTEERWKRIWAYYYTCRNWLSQGMMSGYDITLKACDPDKAVKNHVVGMLGEMSELKRLCVERFCLCLEFMIGGQCSCDPILAKAHDAAVKAIEKQITRLDPEASMLRGFMFNKQYSTYAGLSLCHHKLFRRLDIILSSIGAGTWRATMPMRGIDGFERADIVERFLVPIEFWIDMRDKPNVPAKDELFQRIQTLLGKSDSQKKFLASILVSLLRAQQLYAKNVAEKRMRELWLDTKAD